MIVASYVNLKPNWLDTDFYVISVILSDAV